LALLIGTTAAVLGFLSALVPLFWVLSWSERRHARDHKARVLADLKEAKTRGSHRALSQHPQIDALQCVGCELCVKACPEDGVIEVIDGVAVVVHGARCIGHSRCAEACPVGALKVGLGDLVHHPDMPIVNDVQETSVPGLFIAGELSGLALIRIAIRQGTGAVDEIARRLGTQRGRPDEQVVDVAIVGAGPAGLSAGLRAVEHKLSHVVLEQDELGGTVRHYPRQKLVMTQPVELPLAGKLTRSEYVKEDLVAMFDDIVKRFPIELYTGTKVEKVVRGGECFEITTSKGMVYARNVILALGRRGTPRKLGVPGEELEKVSYRLIDAAHYTGKQCLVVGGGDSAIEAALALSAQAGNKVTLSYRKEAFFRIKARNEQRIGEAIKNGKIEALFGSDVLSIDPAAVMLKVKTETGEGKRELPNDFIFVFAGGTPPFPLLRAAGVQFPAGESRVNADASA
jgi:thioredoxin reductase (NADPH)